MRTCCRCHKKIQEGRDRWVNVRDFNKGKLVGEKDVHILCWKEMIKNDIANAIKEKVNQLMNIIKP